MKIELLSQWKLEAEFRNVTNARKGKKRVALAGIGICSAIGQLSPFFLCSFLARFSSLARIGSGIGLNRRPLLSNWCNFPPATKHPPYLFAERCTALDCTAKDCSEQQASSCRSSWPSPWIQTTCGHSPHLWLLSHRSLNILMFRSHYEIFDLAETKFHLGNCTWWQAGLACSLAELLLNWSIVLWPIFWQWWWLLWWSRRRGCALVDNGDC